ncbi:acetyl-CoA C-acyltransferase family protein [Achromobacter mucicolens]|jgi:acetyl-CoA C-acetyltransferase|uniref:Acetyl-CoA C-acyltransferase family protein n=1 Tax=Achromobacter mucicolens TaxID=1389922 RepID=A0ABD4YT48_9BURK|nr:MULTISPECIES: acetyl-CoA C-acyltransferase family protein [Achromobacter]KXJ66645.1 acetyl-CoA acetyltransferase [Achromobacter xylosoxidans]OXC90222.1 acetyl-CoA acetyltransferase [Achromobacter sp. KAs 3-5]MCU6617885.1 acetyl-CoA C-acyltransferase family protein [Achromobacter mucicolens]MDG9970666.1 acetyl-CoA C-acyltransferase family protein [Achromobacter mucicolens]MDH0092209.1 acetyl-CoA C-acyltransferase family protein [Achromobacter mucicolens]
MNEVIVASAVRTAIGDFGGALKDVPPCDLGATVIRAALERAGVSGDEVGHVAVGHVINTEPRDMYLSRVAAMNAGISKETPAFNVNRLCGSGLQAIVSAAQSIMLGDADIAVGAGAESMSRAPYIAPAQRWGARMGDSVMLDMMTGALSDPFGKMHMGVTAENVAAKFGINRQDQDALAAESHRRAAAAIDAGHFRDQIVPVKIKSRKGEIVFDTDEHVRRDVTADSLAGLKPVFQKENGTVTAGNASGLNDGAGALVLMNASVAAKRGIKPLARLVAYAHAGVDPDIMGIGPVPATQAALKRAGLTVDQLDVIEANEAFAAQACAVSRELKLDAAKVNPNGSGIGLGHPIGATGAIIATKALHELQRVQGRYALVTMCIGGGQGIAAIFERI